MKTPKKGQLCTINNVVFRAKERKYNCCIGCALDNILLCPNIVHSEQLDCSANNIILVRI